MKIEIKDYNETEFYRGESKGYDDRISYDEYVAAMQDAQRELGDQPE